MSLVAKAFTGQQRFVLLLAMIVITYITGTLVNGSGLALSVLILVQLLTVGVALRASEATRLSRLALIGIVLAIVGAVVSMAAGYSGGRLESLNSVLFHLSTLLYLVAPFVIVRYLVRRRDIDVQALVGVLCAYLLVGLSFAFVYSIIGADTSGNLFGASGTSTMADCLFFSFVTLTTTGYGNLVPVGNPGQSVAVLEAITGQLFLILVVSRVVTNMPTRRHPDPPARGDGDVS